MTRFRVTAEFDLEITDDTAAQELAAAVMRELTAQTAADGGTVSSEGGSPEVAIHGLSQNMPLTCSVVVKQLLGRGADAIPFVELANLNVQSVPID